jgi:hypothetical protein
LSKQHQGLLAFEKVCYKRQEHVFHGMSTKETEWGFEKVCSCRRAVTKFSTADRHEEGVWTFEKVARSY